MKDKELIKLERAFGVSYSDDQLEVLKDTSKYISVVACAGSGKTSTILSRMLYRNMKGLCDLKDVLMITFSKKAQIDFQKKYTQTVLLLNGNYSRTTMQISTFHAFFKKLLEMVEGKQEVIDRDMYADTLTSMVRKYKLESQANEDVEEILRLRGSLVNQLKTFDGVTFEDDFSLENTIEDMGVTWGVDIYMEIVSRYNKMKEEYELIDFDDMLVKLYTMLLEGGEKAEEVRTFFRRAYKEVYVDEYQDINEIMVKIMEGLGIQEVNAYVVIGDDDQAIYGFRGANTEHMLNFVDIFEGAKRLMLPTNYRTGKNILEVARKSVEKNKKRLPKEMKSHNDGGEINVIFMDKKGEDYFDDLQKESLKDGADIALLVRKNLQQAFYVDELLERVCAVQVDKQITTLQDMSMYKKMLLVVKMFQNDDIRVLKEFRSMICPGIKPELIKVWVNNRESVWDVLGERDEFAPIIDALYEDDVEDMGKVFTAVWGAMEARCKEMSKRSFGNYTMQKKIAEHVIKFAEGYSYEEYLEKEDSKKEDLKYYSKQGKGIKVLTMHRSKGLEFDRVLLGGLETDSLPDIETIMRRFDTGIKNLEEEVNYYKREVIKKKLIKEVKAVPEYLEEERRLFYVAQTRAKNKLDLLIDSTKRYLYLDDAFKGVVPKEVLEDSRGMQQIFKITLQSTIKALKE